jgi:hypothetical protein
MPVKDLSWGNVTAAWLYGFGIDKHALLSSHKSWIDTTLIQVIRAYDYTPTPTHWSIWCIGGTSRTASALHNARLSQRRADAAKEHVQRALAGIGAKNCVVRSIGVSEVPAILQGRPDEVEYVLDRGVLVVATRSTTQEDKKPPKVIVPPELTTTIDVTFCVAGSRKNVPLPPIIDVLPAQDWDAWLVATYRHPLEKKKVGEYWPILKRGLKIDVEDVIQKLLEAPPLIDSLLPKYFFAGYQTVAFPSVASLSYLEWKDCSLGIRGSTLHLPIYKGMPGGRDLKLELPTTIEYELSTTGQWPPLGFRVPLNDTTRELFEGWKMVQKFGKKEWVR